MNPSSLERLGLTVQQSGVALEAVFPLASGAVMNPITRQLISHVTFSVVGDRLLVIDPPALIGTPHVSLARVQQSSDLEGYIAECFQHSLSVLSRRSAELQALGLSPEVDPTSLQLSAMVVAGPYRFVVGADRQGNFRVMQAARGQQEIDPGALPGFELSEFRESSALAAYLVAMVGDAPQAPRAQGPESWVGFGEVAQRFGGSSLLPPRSALEVLVELRVKGAPYRFAAARVVGRTFRGLLAGPSGKVWADRFELEAFPGVQALVGQVLGVPPQAVEVIAKGKGV